MTPGIRLQMLGRPHQDGYQRMVGAWVDAEGHYPHNDADLALRDFDRFLDDLRDERNGVGLPRGVERQITYVALDPAGKVVGEFRLRPWRCEPYAVGNGHLGFNVAHAHRRRGIATAGLGLLRHHAASHGLPIVVFDVQRSNSASAAVARANHGRVVHADEQTWWYACPTPAAAACGSDRASR
jgi:predicted acetyltransferase